MMDQEPARQHKRMASATVKGVFIAFGKVCDHVPSIGRLEAKGLMGELCWLNHLWAEAYELGDVSYMGELDSIEAAHQTLGRYFYDCLAWEEYLSAYQDLVDM